MTRTASIALLSLLAVFWGINWPIMKLALADYPPLVFRSFASVTAGLGLLLIARVAGQPIRISRREWKPLAVVATLNITVWNLLIAYGISLMNSGRAAILAYTMPLWASLLGALVLGERLNVRGVAALAFGLAAMALLFTAGGVEQEGLLGPTLVVAAAVTWGAGTVAIKHYCFSLPVTVLTAWQHLVGVAPILVGAVLYERHHMGEPTLVATLCLLYNMTVASIFCYWAYFKVVSATSVVISTVGTLMVPVIGVFSTALVYREAPAPVDYVALGAVVVAVFLVLGRPRSEPQR